MRFFIVSEQGDALGVAMQLYREGHEVVAYIRKAEARKAYRGIVKHVASIRKGIMEAPDVVLFDMVGQGKEADKLREHGFKVVGGGEWNDKLELDRKFAMKVFESFGISSPRSFAFRNMMDGAEFAKTHKRLLVLKPFDNKNTAFTYVPKNQDELIRYMAHLKTKLGVDGKILLQEYVDGAEMSTEVWYANGRPVPFPNSTFETKKLMPGDVGPSTGAQTSVVFAYPKREPKIVQQGLKKLSLFLERIGYTGPLDINAIIRKGRMWGIEFCPRFGYNAIYAWMRLLKEPLGKFLHRIANGDVEPMNLREGFGYSLRVSIPPYPYQPEDSSLKRKVYEETEGLCVMGWSKKEFMNVYPLDVYQANGQWKTAGFDGVVAEVTGYGLQPFVAEQEAVNLFKKLSLPQKQARLGDGARVAERRMMSLRAQGYELPPFERPEVNVVQSTSVQPREEKNEKSVQGETASLARKLNVRPGAFADPRVKGSG